MTCRTTHRPGTSLPGPPPPEHPVGRPDPEPLCVLRSEPAPYDVGLPVDFTAFCLLHRHHYRTYVRHRLGEPSDAAPVTDSTVRRALGDLALTWPTALKSRPSAVAWRILRRRVAMAQHIHARTTGPDTVHRLLPLGMADAVLLHHGAGLTPAEAADMMGCDPAYVTHWLLSIRRRTADPAGGRQDEPLRASIARLASNHSR